MSTYLVSFGIGPLGLTLLPAKVQLSNGEKRRLVMQVTNNGDHPIVEVGDIMLKVNGSYVCGAWGMPWMEFYDEAIARIKKFGTDTRLITFFRYSGEQTAKITNGSNRDTTIVLTQRETVAFVRVGSTPTLVEQRLLLPDSGARCFDCSFEAGKPMGLSCHSVLIQLSNGLRLWAAQVVESTHHDVVPGDILGVVNGATIIQPGRTSQATFETSYTERIRQAFDVPKSARFFRFADGEVQLGYPTTNVGQQQRVLWQSVAIVLSALEVISTLSHPPYHTLSTHSITRYQPSLSHHLYTLSVHPITPS